MKFVNFTLNILMKHLNLLLPTFSLYLLIHGHEYKTPTHAFFYPKFETLLILLFLLGESVIVPQLF